MCLSFCPQGVCDRYLLADTPWADTPSGQTPHMGRHPNLGRHPSGRHPLGRHPLWADTPAGIHTPPAQCMLGYTSPPPPTPAATAADGTHPTGMHSCNYVMLTPSGERENMSTNVKQSYLYITNVFRPELHSVRSGNIVLNVYQNLRIYLSYVIWILIYVIPHFQTSSFASK